MKAPLTHQKPINNGPIVILPNDNTMQATHSGILNLPYLPYKAKVAYKFPQISKSLLSMSALCDEGGSATFHKHSVHMWCNNKIILKGIRDPDARLWMVPLDNRITKHPSYPSSIPSASPSANSTANPRPTPSSNPSSAPSNPTAAPSELPSNTNVASAVLETTHTKKGTSQIPTCCVFLSSDKHMDQSNT